MSAVGLIEFFFVRRRKMTSQVRFRRVGEKCMALIWNELYRIAFNIEPTGAKRALLSYGALKLSICLFDVCLSAGSVDIC